MRRLPAWIPAAVFAVVSVASAWLTASRLRVSGDLTSLFPASGEAAALGRWSRASGGRDPAVVLVRGASPEAVASAAARLASELARAPSIERVLERVPTVAPSPDPTLAWALAGPDARARLAAALTPSGMTERLAGSRDLLLAPAGEANVEDWLARDPLRLAQVPWESSRGAELLSGVELAPGAPLEAASGRARLVIAQPRGSAFEADSARALVADVEAAERAAAHPGVTFELTGGHAIARATEQLLRRDLESSGALSVALAALAFVATFRRPRALVAVLPPLALGTLWTTGLAAFLPAGLHALAIAFAAVVVGVGVDTGVHVYAALLDARRSGLTGGAAARAARAATWRPTLTAAAVAALAFASLALSELSAMRELGLLCAAGELLTAVAILAVTPELGALLERRPPPPPRAPVWLGVIERFTGSRRAALVTLAVCAAPLPLLALWGWPRAGEALVAMRPSGLAPLVAEEHVREVFGGRTTEWLVVTEDDDEDRARTRADRVAEAFEPLARGGAIDGFDALGTLAPSEATVRARLAIRDALDLPSRRPALERALRDAGFDVTACAAGLEALSRPSPASALAAGDDALAWLRARHVAHAQGGPFLVATFLRPAPGGEARVRAAVAGADPGSTLTGLDAIERALRDVLARDLVRVGGVALLLVAVALRAALRRARLAAVALAALACEMALVGLAMRALSLRWHVYDALVVPVLFGITIDESMFLLDAARRRTMTEALRTQGPLVASTALTTAAGFAALAVCRFQGLRDLGEVGAIGVVSGLLASLVVVPAAMRVLSGPR